MRWILVLLVIEALSHDIHGEDLDAKDALNEDALPNNLNADDISNNSNNSKNKLENIMPEKDEGVAKDNTADERSKRAVNKKTKEGNIRNKSKAKKVTGNKKVKLIRKKKRSKKLKGKKQKKKTKPKNIASRRKKKIRKKKRKKLKKRPHADKDSPRNKAATNKDVTGAERAAADEPTYTGPWGFQNPDLIDWTRPEYRCPECEDTLIIYDPWFAPPPKLHLPIYCTSNLTSQSSSEGVYNWGPNLTFIWIPGSLNCTNKAKLRNDVQFSVEISQNTSSTSGSDQTYYDCGENEGQQVTEIGCKEDIIEHHTNRSSHNCFWHMYAYQHWRRQLEFTHWQFPINDCPRTPDPGDGKIRGLGECCETGPHLKVSWTGYARGFKSYCGPDPPKFYKTPFDKGRARWLILYNNTHPPGEHHHQEHLEFDFKAPTIGYRRTAAIDQYYYGKRCECGLKAKKPSTKKKRLIISKRPADTKMNGQNLKKINKRLKKRKRKQNKKKGKKFLGKTSEEWIRKLNRKKEKQERNELLPRSHRQTKHSEKEKKKKSKKKKGVNKSKDKTINIKKRNKNGGKSKKKKNGKKIKKKGKRKKKSKKKIKKKKENKKKENKKNGNKKKGNKKKRNKKKVAIKNSKQNKKRKNIKNKGKGKNKSKRKIKKKKGDKKKSNLKNDELIFDDYHYDSEYYDDVKDPPSKWARKAQIRAESPGDPLQRAGGEWPWMTSITYDNKYVCSGYSVSPKFVVTVTKCFHIIQDLSASQIEEKLTTNQLDIGKIVIVVYDKEVGKVEDHEETQSVSKVHVNPYCDPTRLPQHCVLALELTEKIEFGETGNVWGKPQAVCSTCFVSTFDLPKLSYPVKLRGYPFLVSYGLRDNQKQIKYGTYKSDKFLNSRMMDNIPEDKHGYVNKSECSFIRKGDHFSNVTEWYCMPQLGNKYTCDTDTVTVGGGTVLGTRDYGAPLFQRIGRSGYVINWQVIAILWDFKCGGGGNAAYIPTWGFTQWLTNIIHANDDQPCIKRVRKSVLTSIRSNETILPGELPKQEPPPECVITDDCPDRCPYTCPHDSPNNT